MRKINENDAEAVVTFESESAAKTAILLNSALINERPVTVTLYSDSEPPFQSTSNVPKKAVVSAPPDNAQFTSGTSGPPGGPNRTDTVTPGPGAEKPGVLASVLAGAWSVGQTAASKIKEVDEKLAISDTMKKGATSVSQKLKDFDDTHQLSKKAQDLVDTVSTKFKELNLEPLGQTASKVNTALKDASQKISSSVDNLRVNMNQKVATNETLSNGIEKLKVSANSVSQSVHNVSTETKALIEKQKQDEEPLKSPDGVAEASPPANEDDKQHQGDTSGFSSS